MKLEGKIDVFPDGSLQAQFALGQPKSSALLKQWQVTGGIASEGCAKQPAGLRRG